MLVPALELRHIDKVYPPVVALKGASLSIAPGSIHGIVGENGAGKSSLMQVAYGLVQPDHGQVFVDGVAIQLKDPSHAIEHGIGMLHQQSQWLDELTVFDNIMLAESISGLGYQKGAEARAKLEQLSREFGFEFSLSIKLSALDYSQRQLVDVLRSLYRGVRVLILDEPLALLSPSQESYLSRLLTLLKMQGISVVVVSHKLAVLHQLCDVISVIRNGEVTENIDPKQVTLGQLSWHMIGREIQLPHPRVEPADIAAEQLLNIRSLNVGRSPNKRRLNNINLSLNRGEILACVGLQTAGHELLLDVISGLVAFDSGEISLSSQQLSHRRYSIKQAREYGIAYAPSPLLNIGLVDGLSMAESAYLGYQRQGFGRWGILSNSNKHQQCQRLMEDWGIVPVLPAMQSSLFSGGNQQKMVLAREMAHQPKLLLLNQPTHGVDAGASEYFYHQLFALREQGCGIVLCSSDLDEVMSLADKICVFSQGQLIETLAVSEVNKTQLALLIVEESLDA